MWSVVTHTNIYICQTSYTSRLSTLFVLGQCIEQGTAVCSPYIVCNADFLWLHSDVMPVHYSLIAAGLLT